jgi:hypothetical protein
MHAAFKEWAVICEALGTGLQSVIIRKGGIAEGQQGFAFRHAEFFLFPTWFHEQLEKTTLSPDSPVPDHPGEELEVRYTASVEWSTILPDWERVTRLRAFHVLRESVLEERYRYTETEGVHVAFVRVYRLDPPLRLKNEKKYAGCRSWIELPEIEGSVLVSVISDEEHQRRKKVLEELLKS